MTMNPRASVWVWRGLVAAAVWCSGAAAVQAAELPDFSPLVEK